MCNSDMNLSLSGETFSMLKEQFDRVLNRTVGNMQMKGAEDATLTLKLSISLEKENRSTSNGVIEATIPKFKHDISSVMQVKDRISGELVGDYQLVWDADEEKYVMRKIDNGQTSLFQDDEPNGRFVDADYQVVEDEDDKQLSLPAGRMMLTDGSEDEAGDRSPESDESEPDDADESEAPPVNRFNITTPFGWLSQFIGTRMRVTEAAGNYTVRTISNKVVLSSATTPDKPFYCSADILSKHVQHELICEGFGKPFAVISIRCDKCGDTIFELKAPDATDEEIADAVGDDDYEYEEPEE